MASVISRKDKFCVVYSYVDTSIRPTTQVLGTGNTIMTMWMEQTAIVILNGCP